MSERADTRFTVLDNMKNIWVSIVKEAKCIGQGSLQSKEDVSHSPLKWNDILVILPFN